MHKEKVSRMSHEGFFLSRTQKEFILWEYFLDVNFWEYFKFQPILRFLYIIDWINFDLVINFWNQDCEAPKGHWC
jgi:hypothetical protein